LNLIHAIRCKVMGHDHGTQMVQDAVSELTPVRESDPGATGDAESGKQTLAKHPPKAKRKGKP
jgi:hypothetical protein